MMATTPWKHATLLSLTEPYQASKPIKLQHKFWHTVVHPQAVHQVLIAEQAAIRQTNSHTKTRAEVSGTGRKPWKQKGTGRARHGSRRSPLWVGGGVTFGPTNLINYQQKVNRKMYRKVLAGLFAQKASTQAIFLAPELTFKVPKTQILIQQLEQWKCAPQREKILWIAEQFDENLSRSARNLRTLKLVAINQVTVFDLLWTQKIFINEASMEKLAGRFDDARN